MTPQKAFEKFKKLVNKLDDKNFNRRENPYYRGGDIPFLPEMRNFMWSISTLQSLSTKSSCTARELREVIKAQEVIAKTFEILNQNKIDKKVAKLLPEALSASSQFIETIKQNNYPDKAIEVAIVERYIDLLKENADLARADYDFLDKSVQQYGSMERAWVSREGDDARFLSHKDTAREILDEILKVQKGASTESQEQMKNAIEEATKLCNSTIDSIDKGFADLERRSEEFEAGISKPSQNNVKTTEKTLK